ncbi:MAG: MexH family multidrug efflux RND transporter periplasmic adaptor subunit [Saprospiraceae bacterium]|nr:MAG: MexH family multidrug efflux RND transporter periplasmic adaptor subunit [Saprospiraceae bacterium]
MSKKITRWIAIILAILLIGVFILFQSGYFSKINKEPGTDASTAQVASSAGNSSIPVKAQRIMASELSDFILVSGSTMPAEEVMVSSEVPGKVKSILFTEGDWVKKGAMLVRLDDEELQADRNRLQVQAKLNQKIAERFKGLYEKEGVSLQEYEVAQAEYEKAQSELVLVDAQLDKRIIRAPFSGRLGLRLISEGSYLAPGTPIIKLVSSNPIKLEFSVPEKYSSALGRGTQVEFQVEAVPGKLKATIEASDPNIDPATRTYRLKASAPNPSGKILPGAFANVQVNLRDFDATIMVPTEAIVPELGGKKVYVYRSGKAESVAVTTGIRQEANIQITEGLSPGDTLITTGVLQIRPGADVNITEIE